MLGLSTSSSHPSVELHVPHAGAGLGAALGAGFCSPPNCSAMLNLVFFMACPLSAFFTLSLSSPLPPSLAAWRRWLVDRDRRAMSAAFFSSLDILTDGPLGAVLRAASSSAPTLLRI